MRTRLDLIGYMVVDVIVDARPSIYFDDASKSILHLEGQFSLIEKDGKMLLEPPLKDWESSICLCLLGRRVVRAKVTNFGALFIDFDEELSLHVDDGPFVNWRLENSDGMHLYGGCGTVA